jgi:hypothetical protein
LPLRTFHHQFLERRLADGQGFFTSPNIIYIPLSTSVKVSLDTWFEEPGSNLTGLHGATFERFAEKLGFQLR